MANLEEFVRRGQAAQNALLAAADAALAKALAADAADARPAAKQAKRDWFVEEFDPARKLAAGDAGTVAIFDGQGEVAACRFWQRQGTSLGEATARAKQIVADHNAAPDLYEVAQAAHFEADMLLTWAGLTDAQRQRLTTLVNKVELALAKARA